MTERGIDLEGQHEFVSRLLGAGNPQTNGEWIADEER
jgi:hypothetical protein